MLFINIDNCAQALKLIDKITIIKGLHSNQQATIQYAQIQGQYSDKISFKIDPQIWTLFSF